MPSSISNSEFSRSEDFARRRAPGKDWPAVWIGSVLVALALLGSAEAFWRSQGHRPTVVDSPALWSYHRSRVGHRGRGEIVLLGWSRIQLGFATDICRERFPSYAVLQLAIPDRAPVAMLRDLADEDAFQGVVICEIVETGFAHSSWNDQDEYVNYFHRRYWPWHALDVVPAAALQQHLVLVNPNLRLTEVLRDTLANRTFPSPSYLVTRFDRSRLADYTLTDMDERRLSGVRATRVQKPDALLDLDQWTRDVDKVEQWVKRIQSRGGRVVFVRMPVGDQPWVGDKLDYPGYRHWNRMAERTSAEQIHFMDVPVMRNLRTPDGSHLDYRDATRFTAALLDELVGRGVLTDL